MRMRGIFKLCTFTLVSLAGCAWAGRCRPCLFGGVFWVQGGQLQHAGSLTHFFGCNALNLQHLAARHQVAWVFSCVCILG